MGKGNGKAKRPPIKPVFTVDEMKLIRPVLEQKPPIMELPISVLNVDMSYQRPAA